MLHNNYPGVFAANNNPSSTFNLMTSPIASLFYNGHFAVLIFFALSGYVVTLPYKENSKGGVDILKRRLWARYFRLNIPIAVAVFTSYLVYKLGLYWNVEASEISGSLKWLKNYYPNNLTAISAVKEAGLSSIIGSSNFIPPLWTIKIEFIGSLYILAFYICKPKKTTALPMLLLLAFVYLLHGRESIYYHTMFLGSIIPALKNKWKWLLFVTGIYLGAFQFNSIYYDFMPAVDFMGWEKKTFYNAIGALLLCTAIVNGFQSKFFARKPIQFLGKIAYSLYLLHFIILCSISSFVFVSVPNSKINLLINLTVYICLCLLSARFFSVYVVTPSIRLSHKLSSVMFGDLNRGYARTQTLATGSKRAGH